MFVCLCQVKGETIKGINIEIKVFRNLRVTFVLVNQDQNKFGISIDNTPNLRYLNVQLDLDKIGSLSYQWININQIKLKQFYVKFKPEPFRTYSYDEHHIDFNWLTYFIKQFSKSLICLSMDFIDWNSNQTDDLPYNGIRLQQELLESLNELKKVHLYAKLCKNPIDFESILSTFDNKFWFDHNWSIAMHGKYLYTLPFHFHAFGEFIHFDHVQSNNIQALTYPSTWYNVKSIIFSGTNTQVKKVHISMRKFS